MGMSDLSGDELDALGVEIDQWYACPECGARDWLCSEEGGIVIARCDSCDECSVIVPDEKVRKLLDSYSKGGSR